MKSRTAALIGAALPLTTLAFVAPSAQAAVPWTVLPTGTTDLITAVDYKGDTVAFGTVTGDVYVGTATGGFAPAINVPGEVVSDMVVGSDVIWLASAEGLGSYDRNAFDYVGQPAHVQEARPQRMAMDLAGHLWLTSNRGLILHEGTEWVVLDANSGLPTTELTDVEVDEGGRVWVLAADRVMLLER